MKRLKAENVKSESTKVFYLVSNRYIKIKDALERILEIFHIICTRCIINTVNVNFYVGRSCDSFKKEEEKVDGRERKSFPRS